MFRALSRAGSTLLLDPMLRVDLAPLSDGLHEMELTPTATDLDLDPEVFDDIAIALRLDIGDRRVMAHFATHAIATLECDRTLNEYRQTVEGTHDVLFTSSAIGEDVEDVFPLPEHGHVIDLAEPVRDTILLSVPFRRVSPEAEDAEIPTRFGGPEGDEPADHRWNALRALRDQLPDSGDDS